LIWGSEISIQKFVIKETFEQEERMRSLNLLALDIPGKYVVCAINPHSTNSKSPALSLDQYAVTGSWRWLVCALDYCNLTIHARGILTHIRLWTELETLAVRHVDEDGQHMAFSLGGVFVALVSTTHYQLKNS